jgi:acyl-CoA synthetase (NDP forming)
MGARRPVYRRAELTRLLDPARIAVVGASPNPSGFGAATLRRLGGFRGTVDLVNPRYAEIDGRACHPSVAALPVPPDCVVIAVAREQVEAVLRDCAEAGAGGAIVFASGYAETGIAERMALQARLLDIARASGMRLIGPNCIGLANYRSGAVMTFFSEEAAASVPADAIGLISQSGALGNALVQGMATGVPFSHMLTSGNACDVDSADLLAFLAEDPGCAAIACLFEGLAAPERFLEAAAIAEAQRKPVIVCKIARGEQGAAAAISHTGSLAGSGAAYAAAFERAGVVVVEHFERLLETARFFAKAPPPKAAGVAVVATSGGAAVICADMAEAHAVRLPQPAPETTAVLAARIPEYGSARNPCDVTAEATRDPASLAACLEALLADPAYGALVYPSPYAYATAADRARSLGEIARRHGKIGCLVWLSQWHDGPGAREVEALPDVALFRSMDGCFGALAAWQRLAARRAAGRQGGAARRAPPGAAAAAAALLAERRHPVLTEREAKPVLAAYGLPVVPEALAGSAEAAVAAAARFGFPVVLKVESPDIPHKTEAGAIRLDLRDAAAVREAHAAILDSAARHAPQARLQGVLVQPMVAHGIEILLGARVDPLFGPIVMVGAGGVLAEWLADSAAALAPLDQATARGLIGRLRAARLLCGFRGSAPVDLDALAGIVVRLSECIADHAATIAEIDVNPLVCAGGARIVAVDALIRCRP